MTASRWLLGLLCIGAMVFPALELSAETDAADLPQKNLTVDLGGGVSMELVLIPPGSFIMGCDKGADDETPAHKVTISKAFYLGKFHVTRQQWKAVMGRDPGKFGDGRHPANNVSWDACQEFLKKL